MPPQSKTEKCEPDVTQNNVGSFPNLKYPTLRDNPYHTGYLWLKGKQADDNAEGLWRVHDGLYDFTEFVDKHPGGSRWLKITQGTDITEAFEAHHISKAAEFLLPKYYVRKSQGPRNSPYTFYEDGFYRTLKRKVRGIIKDIPEDPANRSKFITDLLLILTFTSAILAANIFNIYTTIILATISSAGLCFTAIAAHNFFHQRDSFRMYYFDLTAMSSQDWRISHSLSHHLYTNTLNDLEISYAEPFFQYLPKRKSFITRYGSWIYSPIIWGGIFISSYVRRIVGTLTGNNEEVLWHFLIPFTLPLSMFLFSFSHIGYIFLIWGYIMAIGSFFFGLIGVNAAHHHPNIFHDGDTPRLDRDWGLAQLDAVMDRHDINGNHFLVLTNFGDHALHHLFPTVDHGKLNYLYPTLQEVCKQFDVDVRITSQWKLIIGQFQQLAKITPNEKPPNLKKRTEKIVIEN